jgi:hypothetical protein
MTRFLPYPVAFFLASLLAAAPDSGPADRPPAPPRVDLRADQLPLAEALERIRKQTGVTVTDDRGEPAPAISVDLRGATFWQAVDAVADAARARVVVGGPDGRVTLTRRLASERAPPTSYDGDFRVRLLRIHTTRDFDSDRGSCTLSMEVAWLPALRPLFLRTPPEDLRVRDEGGKAVAVPEEAAELTAVDGRYAHPFDLVLPAFPRSARRIGEVSGKLTAVAPSKMLTYHFNADLKALKEAVPGGALRQRTQEGVVCRLARVTLDPGRWTVAVALAYPEGGQPLESYQSATLVVNNELTLRSKDGKRSLAPIGYVVERVDPRRSVVAYHFLDRPGRPRGKADGWRVQFRAPARIAAVGFGFRFKDVPLP